MIFYFPIRIIFIEIYHFKMRNKCGFSIKSLFFDIDITKGIFDPDNISSEEKLQLLGVKLE